MSALASRAHARAREAVPPLRAAALAALAVFACISWAALVRPAPSGRMGAWAVALVASGLALGVAARSAKGRARGVAIALAGVAGAALSALAAGIPARFLSPGGWGALASGIGQGLGALPSVNVPYDGLDPWTRSTILLGGGLLTFAGALLASRRAAQRDGGRLTAALPLIVAAALPSALVAGRHESLAGLGLFALLAALLWAERLRARELIGALVLVAAAAAAGLAGAPVLERTHPLVDYRSLVTQLRHGAVTFDWSQRYGPLDWPRDGSEVLRVRAARFPAYWKAENLDVFDGRGWSRSAVATVPDAPGELPQAARANRRWRERLRVTVRGMQGRDVIGAGATLTLGHLPAPALGAGSAGTYVLLNAALAPGDTYSADVVVPRPTAAALAHAPSERVPARIAAAYLELAVPDSAAASGSATPVAFRPFSAHGPLAEGVGDASSAYARAALARSAYGPVLALARRLAARSSTPAAYVAAVERLLGHGFAYDERVRTSTYPLADFLLRTHRGYCQQFAGAMALLLRMGGVPARVATGFTTGSYDPTRQEYVVRDYDAHAWVEAWFPRYGWVTFDPTPVVAPARRGLAAGSGTTADSLVLGGGRASGRAGVAARRAAGGIAGGVVVLAAAGAALVLLLVVALRLRLRVPPPSAPELAELERALAITRRAPDAGTTLRALEHRFRHSERAAGYVAAVRRARYAADGQAPTTAQRRALRRELAAGLGPSGRLRALIALPPRLPRLL